MNKEMEKQKKKKKQLCKGMVKSILKFNKVNQITDRFSN